MIGKSARLGGSEYGLSGYTMPTNEMMFKKPKFGTVNQKKLLRFAEEIMKQKSFIPGVGTYSKVDEWKDLMPPASGKFTI